MDAADKFKSSRPRVRNAGETSVYEAVREMAISFQFRPGERINEGLLAQQLGVSRTPLREAMQNLVSEKLLRWERNKGFFCRMLDENEAIDLYEFRQILEAHATRLACQRATDEALQSLDAFVQKAANADDQALEHVLQLDCQFHERVSELSGNTEILAALRNVNQRTYFIRWLDMAGRRSTTQGQHRQVTQALLRRDDEAAVAAMNSHVEMRKGQIADFIRQGYGMIFTGNTPSLLYQDGEQV